MIIRRWRATADYATGYIAHFRRRVLPELLSINGFRGALVLHRKTTSETEIEVLTFWESMRAIRGFAGSDLGRSVVEPEAKRVLRRFDRRVRHFEIVLDALPLRAGKPQTRMRRERKVARESPKL
jgi:heme-degrading monooxygenase HmoA